MKTSTSTDTKSRYPLSEQLHREEYAEYKEKEAVDRALMATVLKEYPLPIVRGPAAIAPVTDDPWAALELNERKWSDVDELNALDPNDRPPSGWLTIKPETRQLSLGLALYLCDLFPRNPQLIGERKDKLHSVFGMCFIVLASGEVPIGLNSTETAFFTHFVQPSFADRVAWRDAHQDIFHHCDQAGVGQMQQELISRMDRVGEGGVVALIKAGIARGLAALRERRSKVNPWRG